MKKSPYINNYEKKPRKIGIEIELAGLDIKQLADITTGIFGGNPEFKGKYCCKIPDSQFKDFGSFTIELDASLIKEGKLSEYIALMGIEDLQLTESIEDFLAKAAMNVIPMEIVCPPVPLSRLNELEELRKALRNNAAEDTKTSVFNAFGLHLNPEVPSLEASELRDFIRSFIILYDWLHEKLAVDTFRQLTPYIEPFDKKYSKHILQPDYEPDISTLINDYIDFNPTRNRPLDMLPLFTYIDRDLVTGRINDNLTTARPTFHYRLPNCNLTNPEWSFTSEWDNWVIVERIAVEKGQLAKLCKTYLNSIEHPHKVFIEQLISKWGEAFL